MDAEDTRFRRARFGAFELDLESGELRRAGVFVHLPAQPMAVLELLVREPAGLVTREQIGRTLWHDRWAEFDQGINTCISQVRNALGDHADSPAYIETVPRRGYRFIAPVEWLPPVEQYVASNGSGGEADNPDVGNDRADTGRGPDALRALRWPAAIVAGLFVIAAVAVTRGGQPENADPRLMLAVLPFEHLHADSAYGFLGEGVADELITLLANVAPDRLGVIARTSSTQFRTGSTVTEIGDALGVDYVVEGSVRSGPERVRISVQLIRVNDQSHVWARTYDRRLVDALDVERDVASQVTRSLAIQLVAEPPRAGQATNGTTTASPARLSVLEGRFLLNRADAGDTERALALFESAVALDSTYAPGWTGLAKAIVSSATLPGESVQRARGAALTAVRLDDEQVEAHLLLASFLYRTDWDWDSAESEYLRAVRLAPGRADVHHAYALFLASLRRADEAMSEIRTALLLDPVSTLVIGDAAFVSYLARDYDTALQQAEHVLNFDPDNLAMHSLLLHIHTAMNHDGEAIRHGLELGRIVRRSAAGAAGAAPAGVESGPAADVTSDLTGFWNEWIVWWRTNSSGGAAEMQVALGFAGLGQQDSTIATLERAFALRAPGLVNIAAEPAFDDLRDHPRFRTLVEGVGLSDVTDGPPDN